MAGTFYSAYPQNLVVDGQYEPGLLSQCANQRSKPQTVVNASARVVKLEEQTCPVLVEFPPTQQQLALMISYHISRCYDEPNHHDINPKRLLVALAGGIASISTYNTMRPWLPAVSAFRTIGVKLIIEEMNARSLPRLRDERLNHFLNLFGDDVGFILKDTVLVFGVFFTMLLVMTKNASAIDFDKWMKRRVIQFLRSMGDERAVEFVTDAILPEIAIMRQLANIASASFHVRRLLFITMVAISNSRESNFISIGINEVVNMMRFTEMTHLVIIDKYILVKYPELNFLQCMQGLKKVMEEAIKFLESLNAYDRSYARLLVDKDVAASLNRNRFDTYIVVATSAAKFENATFQQYIPTGQENMLMIAEMVTQYLHLRTRLLALRAGEGTQMGPVEKKLFLESTIKRFNEEMTGGVVSRSGIRFPAIIGEVSPNLQKELTEDDEQ